jgi:hypothetical protein
MEITNEELVEKVISTLNLSTGGKLNDAQSDKFIDYVVDETVLKNNARVVRFRNENLIIDKIGIGKRAAVPKAEAKDPGIRRGINTSKVTLTPSEIMVPIEISDNFRELNIEGDNVSDKIIRMFATQLANDTEELYILGNKLGPAVIEGDIVPDGSSTQYIKDSFLALQKGWLELADGGHRVDAAGTNIGFAIFSQALRAMPTKFRRNKKKLRWFMSPDLAQIYAEKLTTRATLKGDEAGEGKVMSPFGVPIVEVSLMDLNPTVVEHVTLSGTTAVPLKYKNFTNVVVTPSTLDSSPTTPYVNDTDYDLVAASGTIARDAGGSIGDNDVVKVTYSASPQLILTHMSNFIIGIGRDVRIEKDRDIFKTVDQFAITAKISCEIEEVDAVVKVYNIGEGV